MGVRRAFVRVFLRHQWVILRQVLGKLWSFLAGRGLYVGVVTALTRMAGLPASHTLHTDGEMNVTPYGAARGDSGGNRLILEWPEHRWPLDFGIIRDRQVLRRVPKARGAR